MLFFEYYTKYNSSPTEHQVFTSPPTERSIYFVHHHVLPLSVFIFQEHSSVNELMLQGSPRALRCSRTLARPRSCSGTRQTTPCSQTSRQTLRALGLLARPLRALGLLARPLRARGLARPLRARDSTTIAKATVCHVDHHVGFPRRRPVSTRRPDPI